MKKLFLFLLFIPVLSFSQTDFHLIGFVKEQNSIRIEWDSLTGCCDYDSGRVVISGDTIQAIRELFKELDDARKEAESKQIIFDSLRTYLLTAVVVLDLDSVFDKYERWQPYKNDGTKQAPDYYPFKKWILFNQNSNKK
jgi:hypothetical protein